MLTRAASGLHSQPDECPNILHMNSVTSILVIFSHLFLPLPSGSICQVSPHQNTVCIYVLFLACPFIQRQTEDNIKMDFVHGCGTDSTGSERDQVVSF